MAESRVELIAWVNELLGLGYTKVEQLGSGAAYAQIMDSIYGDLPMNRIKFATKHEYEYLGNYKVLQNCFTARKIDKSIPIDRLMKCKMQDNLEFLQWAKKFWDQNFPGEYYDAAARRGAGNEPPSSGNANRSTTAPNKRVTSASNRSMTGRASALANTSLRGPSPDHTVVLNLQKELQGERTTVVALEKERDFYFGKLRDIEMLIQQDLGENPEGAEVALLKEIQAVLYSTEEGFEMPPEEQALGDNDFPDETF
ncbi:MAG: calponin homology domain-containing protein [Linnemannia gamsii]|nr:hypothetical protein BGX24_009757 [Mortierella sp. AD032]KAK3844725.1 MAG: calponin homology domain-containing protein [Linnemannia gamsii]